MGSIYFVVVSIVVLLVLNIQDGDADVNNIAMDCSAKCGSAKKNYICLIPASNRNMSIYYDLNTNATLEVESADASRLPHHPIRLISRGLPCSCQNLKCGCCAGLNITAIKFQRRACTNITIVPEEFAIDFDVLMDEEQVFTNRVSARNPPPACVPLYFFPAVTFCVRFFDLHIADNKMNACIDFETRLAQWPMFILHFNCVKVGGNGITWVRPSNEGGTPLIANVTVPEVYDDVNFEVSDENSYLSTSTLTPEEEAQIGTLKL